MDNLECKHENQVEDLKFSDRTRAVVDVRCTDCGEIIAMAGKAEPDMITLFTELIINL